MTHFNNLFLLACDVSEAASANFFGLNFVLKVFNNFTISAVKENKLVWNYTHFKKGKGLTLGFGEAFNNVVNSILFMFGDDVL